MLIHDLLKNFYKIFTNICHADFFDAQCIIHDSQLLTIPRVKRSGTSLNLPMAMRFDVLRER